MENLSKQKKRKALRYPCRAQVRIPETLEGDAVLKDVSSTGCRIAYESHVNIQLRNTFILHIIPENKANIESFELLVESRWYRLRGNSCEIGFTIISSPVLFSQYRHWCLKSR